MASRGHLSSSLSGKPVQAPGMMRHGPFPGYSPPVRHPFEPVNPAEILEKKIALQEAEMDKLAGENRRLASTHISLRQELVAIQHEIQQIRAHAGSIHDESEIKIRGFLEKITKAEADIYDSEEVRKELQKINLEGQNLFTERQELTTEIQHMAEALQKAMTDVKNLPETRAELEGLRQEHKKLRSAFEFEKNLNKEQVEKMCGMEKNLLTMANEVERLRAEILKIEKTAQVPNQFGSTHGTATPGYSSADQAFVHHKDQGYSHGGYWENVNGVISNYSNSGYSNGGLAGYSHGYGMVSTQMTGGAAVQSGNPYSTVVSTVYPNSSIVPIVSMAGGMQVGDGTMASIGSTAYPYDGPNVGVSPLPQGGPPPSVSWR